MRPATATGVTTWRFNLGTRIALGFLAAFMFGVATLQFSLAPAFSGNHSGSWIVMLAALVTMGFCAFATFALIAAVRTRVTLGAATRDAVVVDGHNWFLMPHFREVRVPLSDIRSVERRSEIFRTLGLSTMRDALSIVTADGERIGLFSNTLGSASTLPLAEVAGAIAEGAGVAVTDDGTVLTKGSGLYGEASSAWTEQPLDAVHARKASHVAVVTLQICTLLLILTFVLRAFH